MEKQLPQIFFDRLQQIIPAGEYPRVCESFSQPAAAVVRVNTLKVSVEKGMAELVPLGFNPEIFPGVPEALFLNGQVSDAIGSCELSRQGRIYQQGLSSMLVVCILDPRPDETVLDLCAAPGSKAGQIAARMNNTGRLDAVEAIRPRYYKLKAVLDLLGVTNARCVCADGRHFCARDGLYDRVLVDAPCSSEGRFKIHNSKTFAYWSPRKIKEMVRKQRGLARHGFRQLKPGGILVYATCTFSPEENEGVVDWLLRKEPGSEIMPVSLPDRIADYPALARWGTKIYHERINQCVRILPGPLATGFFIAKIRKAG